MFDTVVKDADFAFLPLPCLAADPQPCRAGNKNRQMADQARIDQAVMRRNVRAGLQEGEQDRRCLTGPVPRMRWTRWTDMI